MTKTASPRRFGGQLSHRLLVMLLAGILGTQLAGTPLLSAPQSAQASNYFLDVPSNHPNYQAIATLRRLNIIRGFVDSTFQPDKQLNKAEFLKLAIAAKGIRVGSAADAQTSFRDVSKTDWFAPYVSYALSTGIIEKSADRLFRPTKPVTRAEAVKILLNLFDISRPTEITNPPYNDVPVGAAFVPYAWAIKFRQLFPISDESFEPEKSITRGEASELVYRILAIATNEANVFSANLRVDMSALVMADQSEAAPARDQILDRAFVQLDELTKRAIAKVRESMVSVIIFQDDRKEVQAGGGSGIIISTDGYIITNKHVVGRGAEASLVYYKDQLWPFRIIAVDPLFDLAVIKVEQTNLTPAVLGDSDAAELGDTVLSMGYSLSTYRDSVGRGVISGRSRTITAGGGGTVETLTGMLQTDTPISPGNSGGPLFNLWGEVLGINTAIDTRGNNLAFAIPINDLKSAIADAKANGKIERPFLGVRFVTLDTLNSHGKDYGTKQGAFLPEDAQGALSPVIPDSPAAKAGLQARDVILKVDDITLDSDRNTLLAVIQRYRPNDTVNLTVLRDGQLVDLSLTIGSKTAPIPTYEPEPQPVIIRIN